MYILLNLSLVFSLSRNCHNFFFFLSIFTLSLRLTSFAITVFWSFNQWIAWKSRLSTCTPAVSNVSTTRSSSSPPLVSWGSPTISMHPLLEYCSCSARRFSTAIVWLARLATHSQYIIVKLQCSYYFLEKYHFSARVLRLLHNWLALFD